MKADPKFSQGARLERSAFRNMLRRRLTHLSLGDQNEVRRALAWVDQRRLRYDRAKGGLGKK